MSWLLDLWRGVWTEMERWRARDIAIDAFAGVIAAQIGESMVKHWPGAVSLILLAVLLVGAYTWHRLHRSWVVMSAIAVSILIANFIG